MKTFACKDIGMDCDWKTEGVDDKEIINKARVHGRDDHGMKNLDGGTINKIKAAIHTVKEEFKGDKKAA